ncbi:hypothetical protein Tco_1466059 [Tanacetum coccineum]
MLTSKPNLMQTTRTKARISQANSHIQLSSASEEDSDPGTSLKREKEMQTKWLHCQVTSSNSTNLQQTTSELLKTRNKNVDTTPRYKNDNQSGQFVNQRKMTVVGARETIGGQEKMLLCKQAEKGVQLQAQQSGWLPDTDEEIDEQELEAHYSYMEKIQEVHNANSSTDSEPLEQDMYDNDIQNDQNVVECDDERVVVANLIANLKLNVYENKKIQMQLKKANASLTQEWKECKSTPA